MIIQVRGLPDRVVGGGYILCTKCPSIYIYGRGCAAAAIVDVVVVIIIIIIIIVIIIVIIIIIIIVIPPPRGGGGSLPLEAVPDARESHSEKYPIGFHGRPKYTLNRSHGPNFTFLMRMLYPKSLFMLIFYTLITKSIPKETLYYRYEL